MAEKYTPAEIEAKWQQKWEADGIYHADIDPARPKHYALTMLPYPSGNLHIGHWYAMTPSDARARYMRMRGHNVMFPMGFDAFGLPAENAAIQRNIHPKKWTYANIENMRKQLRSMGAMFDWRREAVSSDPEYYKWTQWFFLQFYKHGLAYRKMAAVDWCPKDNTTLAREQVVGEKRVCERCGTPVIKKNLEQWFFRITNYADELLNFVDMDWPQQIETLQTNWIGRSEGATVVFKTESGDEFTIFTTRPDTLWGATFMVLAPEHPLVAKVTSPDKQAEVEAYVAEATRQTDIERESTEKEKTGVFTGGYAINPVSGERVPIWTADYVLMTYGTGAIMAVPAHDARDFAFARKYGLEVRPVVQPQGETLDGASMTQAVTADGVMVNSGPLTGTAADKAIADTIAFLQQKQIGTATVGYRIRDWLISRQRYWGAPIPIVYCKDCGAQPVPEDQLPVELPEDVEWTPTGESPLKLHPTWKHTACPKCGGPAERDTDTMDTFMCSSWYFLRYLSPHYDKAAFDPNEYDYWMPVDTYTGGAEHAVMHLLYVRFFHKALRDIGVTEGHEPMLQLRNQGQILGPDGQRMSKSRGNVIDPDEQVRLYGADTVRAYLMFGYRWNEGGAWSDENIQGVVRWMHKVWTLFTEGGQGSGKPDAAAAKALRRKVHQTIQKVSRDLETFEFNTIISAYMELANTMTDLRAKVEGSPEWDEAKDIYLRLMAPVTPHVAEELWAHLGKPYSVHKQSWPVVDEAAAREDEITLVVQINGKLKDRITVPAGISDEEAKAQALASEAVARALEGKTPRQVIVVKGKLVNIVM
ncbi:MAG TPA: leucine--tRNA ligase [Anaerolineales bacterium]|nr:leucine--tRNA ligase [Anaerolineales bacterium]HRQ92123.1 leucine--tRNA ligase [Anaerolineales bacterium]